jgi:uncharacterized protein (DUF169 family)
VVRFEELSGWLTDCFGGRWVPIRFLDAPPIDGQAEGMRFCEAIKGAARSSVILTESSVTCPGAKRSFGWARGMDENLAESMAGQQGIPLAVARELVRSTPHLDSGIQAIEIGGKGRPDLVVSYATPVSAMKVIRAVELATGAPLAQRLSNALSVCGGVAARCVKTGEVSVSFGCAESRRAAGMGKYTLTVGIPWVMVEKLFDAKALEAGTSDATSRECVDAAR